MSTLLGELLVKLGCDTKGLSEAETKMKAFGTKAKDLGSQLTSAGTTLTAAVTLPLVGAAGAAVALAGKFQQTQIAFTTMLGSAEKSNAFLKDLEAFAKRTPFEFNDLTEASKRMMALGFSAEQVIPTLTSVGDATAALGGGSEMINRVTLALGQMQAKGKVSAEEMRQLAEAGIPAWEFLATSIGVKVPEAMKMAEKGAIQASTAIPAILAGMNDKFAGLMEKQSQTLLGQLSNMKDDLFFTLRDLGSALLPIAAKVIDNFLKPMLSGLKSLAEWFSKLPGPIQTAVVVLGALAAAAGPVLMVIGSITTGIGTLVPLLPAIGTGFTAMTAALGPLGLALAAVAAAILIFHEDIENAIVSTVRFLGLADDLPEVVGKSESAYKRVSAEMKVLDTLMGQLNAGTITRKEYETALQKELNEGRITQERYNAEIKKSINPKADAAKASAALAAKLAAQAEAAKEAAEEMKKLKENTIASLNPMNNLGIQLDKQMKLGFSKSDLVKLYADEIINAAKKQRELGRELSDNQIELLQMAKDYKNAQERAREYTGQVNLLSDELLDNTNVLIDNARAIDAEKEARQREEDDLLSYARYTLPELKSASHELNWELKTGTKEATKEAKEQMNSLGQAIGNALTDITDDIADKCTKWAGPFQSFAKAAFQSLLSGLFNPLLNKLAGVGNALGNWLGGIFSGNSGGAGGLWSSIKSVFSGGSGGGSNPLGQLTGGGSGGGLGGLLQTGLSKLFGGGASSAIGASAGYADYASSLGVNLTGGASSATNGVNSAISGATKTLGKVLGAVGGGIMALQGMFQSGAQGWMNTVGGGTMVGLSVGGPIGAAIGAAAGAAAKGIQSLVKKIQGPNSWEALSKEISRDYGGVNLDAGIIQQLGESLGITEKKAWDVRKNISSSPAFLATIASAAEQQGKMEEFMNSISKMGTAWGTFDFETAFQTGLDTGNWADLNKMWTTTSKLGDAGFGKRTTQGSSAFLMPEQTAVADALASSSDSVPATVSTQLSDLISLLQEGETTDKTVTINTGSTPINLTVEGAGEDLVTRVKNEVIPLLIQEMASNGALKDAIMKVFNTSAEAY